MHNRQIVKSKPDCSAITDDMLRPLIISKWRADKDGKIRIPFSFFGNSRVKPGSVFTDLSQKMEQLPTVGIPHGMEYTLRVVITRALKVWSKISNNKIIFVENEKQLSSTGIRFNLVSSSLMYQHQRDGSASITLDNSGFINLADIFFVDNKTFWQQALTKPGRATQIIHHEIEHALGLSYDWPYKSQAMQTLHEVPEGMLCSVMPYAHLAKTQISACKTNCTHYQASLPGEVDIRMYQLTYEQPYRPRCLSKDSWRELQIIANNSLDSMASSAIISAMHSTIVSFAYNLKLNEADKASLSSTSVHLIADACMLGALIYCEIPTFECTVFTINAALKYAPKGIMPETISDLANSGAATYAFNMIQGIRKGNCILPYTATLTASLVGSIGGDYCGEVIGATLGRITSYVVRGISSLFSSKTKETPTPKVNVHARMFGKQDNDEFTTVDCKREPTFHLG